MGNIIALLIYKCYRIISFIIIFIFHHFHINIANNNRIVTEHDIVKELYLLTNSGSKRYYNCQRLASSCIAYISSARNDVIGFLMTRVSRI